MKRETVRILGQMLLIIQFSVTLADFAHTEILSIGGLPDAIENHDCGTKEIHKSLDSCQPCLPCCRTIHLAAPPEVISFNAAIAQTLLSNPDCSRCFEAGVISSSPKRGPPGPATV